MGALHGIELITSLITGQGLYTNNLCVRMCGFYLSHVCADFTFGYGCADFTFGYLYICSSVCVLFS